MNRKRNISKKKRFIEMAQHCELQQMKADLCSHHIHFQFIDKKPDIDISDFSLHTVEQALRAEDYVKKVNKRLKEVNEKLMQFVSKSVKLAAKQTGTIDYEINDDAGYEEYKEKLKREVVGLGFNEDLEKFLILISRTNGVSPECRDFTPNWVIISNASMSMMVRP